MATAEELANEALLRFLTNEQRELYTVLLNLYTVPPAVVMQDDSPATATLYRALDYAKYTMTDNEYQQAYSWLKRNG